MLRILKKSFRSEKGQGLPEYALLLITIVVVCVIALTPVGEAIQGVGTSVSTTISEKASELQSESE